jgi:outer membrane receptor for ferrienterochelin and colicin
LDEVVVIGYGSQKKGVTGAVSTVDSKTLEILKPVKVEQALQGTVSVNVTSTSGAPGAKLDIRIRGCYKRRKRTNNNYRWVCWRIRFVDIETITV